jgi:hypothetical protein
LIGDELIENGIGEHAPHTLLAVADGHIWERARFDMAVERLDRATELGCRLGLRAQAIGWASADGPRLALACGSRGWRL